MSELIYTGPNIPMPPVNPPRTETPLVTPDALNKLLTEENSRLGIDNSDLRARERVAKEANDAMHAENERLHAQINNLLKPMRDQAIAQLDVARADLAARDALLAELRAYASNARKEILSCCSHAAIAHLDALLARTPKDAGAEVERLREEIKRYSEVVVRDLLERNGELCAERDAMRAQLNGAEKDAAILAGSHWKQRAEAAEAIITSTLRELPVGNVRAHTADTIPERVADLVKSTAEAEKRIEELTDEHTELGGKAELAWKKQLAAEARLAAVLGAADAALAVGWRAGITCSANVCTDHSNRLNADDGDLALVRQASDLGKQIARWLEPTPETLEELRGILDAARASASKSTLKPDTSAQRGDAVDTPNQEVIACELIGFDMTDRALTIRFDRPLTDLPRISLGWKVGFVPNANFTATPHPDSVRLAAVIQAADAMRQYISEDVSSYETVELPQAVHDYDAAKSGAGMDVAALIADKENAS